MGLIEAGAALLGGIGSGKRQKKAIEAQMNAQKELNEQAFALNEKAAQNAFERQMRAYERSYQDQSYSAMRKQMEDAGLSVGLMYGGSGSGGGTGQMAGTQGAGAAGGGQASSAASMIEAETQRKMLGVQLAKGAAEASLAIAEARKAKADADKTDQETETERQARDYVIAKLAEEGRAKWIDNTTKWYWSKFDGETAPESFEAKHRLYGTLDINKQSREFKQGWQEYLNYYLEGALKTSGINVNQAQQKNIQERTAWIPAEMANETMKAQAAKAMGDQAAYNAATARINALANQLAAAYNYGDKFNAKWFVDRILQATGLAIGAYGAYGINKGAGGIRRGPGGGDGQLVIPNNNGRGVLGGGYGGQEIIFAD